MFALRAALATLALAAATTATCGILATPAFAAPEPTPTASTTALLPGETLPDWPVIGEATVQHGTWGQVSLTALFANRTGLVAFTNSRGEVLWEHSFDDLSTFALAPIAQDATGNVFFTYDPGRLPGVIVLRPTDDGFAIIADSYPNNTAGLDFYGGILIGPVDGRYAIDVSTNDCDPSCAGGTTTVTRWAWTGSTYTGTLLTETDPGATSPRPTTPAPSSTPKPTRTPTATTPAPTATAPAPTRAPRTSTTPTATASPPTTTTSRGVPAKTGAEESLPILPLGVAGAALTGATGVLVTRARGAHRSK